MTKCPICGKDTGVYYWPSALDWMMIDVFDMELYQRSYPGKAKYVSERCVECYDKAIKEEDMKGFGLIELLLVLAILGILAAVVIPAVIRLLEG